MGERGEPLEQQRLGEAGRCATKYTQGTLALLCARVYLGVIGKARVDSKGSGRARSLAALAVVRLGAAFDADCGGHKHLDQASWNFARASVGWRGWLFGAVDSGSCRAEQE